MHAIEKILAKNSGRTHVKTGEIITAKIDFAEINDRICRPCIPFMKWAGRRSGITPGQHLYLTIMHLRQILKVRPTTGK